jgi:hypothetical protein
MVSQALKKQEGEFDEFKSRSALVQGSCRNTNVCNDFTQIYKYIPELTKELPVHWQ